MLRQDGHKLILWSVRKDELLEDAVRWCRERGLEFYAVNKEYPEEEMQNNIFYSRKLKVDLWIDDRNVGGLPDWGIIYRIIKERTTYEAVLFEKKTQENQITPTKRKWWKL